MYTSADTIWVLLGAALVFFMQAGFAMVETGFTRAKNAGNIVMKNLMDFALGTPIFWIVGFGLMFGAGGSLFGWFDPLVKADYAFLGLPVPPARLPHLPDGVLRYGSHHRLRRHGGAHEIPFLLHLFRCHFRAHLPH